MQCPYCKEDNPPEIAKCAFCGKFLIQSQGVDGDAEPIQDHLALAVLVTLFCCQPFGLVSLVYATQVNTFLVGGYYKEAKEASEKAWDWIVVGFWSAFGLFAIIFFFLIIAAFA